MRWALNTYAAAFALTWLCRAAHIFSLESPESRIFRARDLDMTIGYLLICIIRVNTIESEACVSFACHFELYTY